MTEEIQLLKEASFEIKSLRRQNEIMSARLEMFDSINAILHTQVATKNQCYSPDVVCAIEEIILKMKAVIEELEK